MNTSIAIRKDIRDQASQKAQTDGLSISAVVRILLLDYANGRIEIGSRSNTNIAVEKIEVDSKTQKMMDDVILEWNKNK
ncbi:hypothetical protein COY05_05095 [Candidatus Peregrinibacteria bacterium CG_4_10_14_0_2_um_filter_38_24]|nr:MAG: hypothetical protein COY05_05095 [Candidatus Peregrinibacteria bacterium CG_4_10_14_0_2_um_filter_38_24]PJC39347.1 MAG: hypothetical protein CO044_00285 [Candidatus Peregrinibacteria bacterium CG_4_9_14_0_2_um_filter_38_9]